MVVVVILCRCIPLQVSCVNRGTSYAFLYSSEVRGMDNSSLISRNRGVSNPAAEALRIVGRDLDLRGIKTFIIRCDRNGFVVNGGYQPPPSVMPVTVHYASSDIDRQLIDAKNNDCLSAARDFSSIAEILLAIGNCVTKKQGRIISISNTASTPKIPIIIVKYAPVETDPVVEIFKGSALYELCVSAYKESVTSNDPHVYSIQ